MHDFALPRPHRPLLASAAVALLLFGLAACGSDDSTPAAGDGGSTTTAATAAEKVVVAEDFSLTDLAIRPGELFTLDNQGGTAHTLTADDGSFDSGPVDAGSQSTPLTALDTPGEYPFHCSIHGTMTGTLTVEG
jgi:plastocyanin